MKIAILGGGSCFALDFARLLHSSGIEHFGIGRSKPKSAPFWLLDHHYRYWDLHLVNQLDAVMGVLDTECPDIIVNWCAQGEGASSFTDYAPDFFMTNTVALVRLVLELQKRSYLRRFVQIGSSEVYGSTEKPAKETDCLRPTSPYSASKAAFDHYLDSMWRTAKFPMNIVRPSNCYVEGQQLHRIIPKAIVFALTGRKLPLHGGGKAQKSYLHARDLSKAIMAVIERAAPGASYNVAPTSSISIGALVGFVAETCGVSFDELVEESPDRVGQDAKYLLDATAIARDCGWTMTVGLARGLEGMVSWVRKYPELLTMPTTYEHRR